jgi:hypothetical protein
MSYDNTCASLLCLRMRTLPISWCPPPPPGREGGGKEGDWNFLQINHIRKWNVYMENMNQTDDENYDFSIVFRLIIFLKEKYYYHMRHELCHDGEKKIQ